MTDTANTLWQAIIALRAYFKRHGLKAVEYDLRTHKVAQTQSNLIRVSDISSIVSVDLTTSIVSFAADCSLDKANQELFAHYLKCLLITQQADTLKRAVVIVHCAQTLDAKMATASNHSQWIGNQENLVHAHRMRALTDAIMVGAKTYEVDQPSLTVRHVEGENPVRLVLTSAPDKQSNQDVCYVGNEKRRIGTVLKELYQTGVKSIFLEGGAKTISTFLESQYVDYIQLHIAPMLLGSGKHISLPEVQQVTQSILFSDGAYLPIGDEMMFVGVPDYTAVGRQQDSAIKLTS